MKQIAANMVDEVRRQNPLIDCITNYITTNDCANMLLAFGASPAMCDARDESYGFAQISAGLYINFGTYNKEQEMAAVEGALGAKHAGIPIVVDPVGCGAIPRRPGILAHLHRVAGIDVIKGNMGEIMALAGRAIAVKGVDSEGVVPGIEEACRELALRFGCVVAATGQVDVITDGKRLVRVHNGVPMLKTVTGAGCMTGALCTATAAAAKAVGQDMLAATVGAIMSMCIAGELAFEQAQRPGSFRVALIDNIYDINGALLLERGKIDVE